ncbi:SIR2 family protein [Undibacterium sp. Ji42W]|uniref:SIR2 family protein n=1 Tax=Undibacterium sp. Ji42W TaxID=3413039 RepID=UPI003BF1625B
MTITIPLGLKTAIESGNCVLFIGAGIGYHMTGSDNNLVPDGAALAKELAIHFKIDTDSEDLTKVSQVVALRRGRSDLDDFLRKRLANIVPDEHVRWLTTNRWRAIYTTNYDFGIERAYELNSSPLQAPISISSTQDLVEYDLRFQVPIYHIHGALFGEHQNIVITEDDYTIFRERRRMLFEQLKQQFATSTFLYIGYSHRDPNWKLVLHEIATEFAPSKLPISYRVTPKTDAIDIEILRSRGIECLDCYFNEFAELARSELNAATVQEDQLRQIVKQVPSNLVEAFHNNPAAMIRLLKSWEYVNQAPFDDQPNVEAFLQGDIPNWATMGGKHYFSRDIEEEVFDYLLDYATTTPKGPASHILVGPAGYGVSTILMSLAVRSVTENIGPVFFHKIGQPVLEGDIEYAASLFPNIPFFFIDNAADRRHGLTKAIAVLREQKKPALFLLGEQRNEWAQAKGRISGQQFPVESLSDDEINKLLDFLSKNHALNKLEPLSRDLQFAAVKKTHGKELLVAMREATEELGFDAILEHEYRGIEGDMSKRLYLIVACIYQHDALIRDVILAAILGTSVAEMYLEAKNPTDGVVVFECADEVNNVYIARTRHRTIARIVWERCGSPTDKEEILQSLVSKLNLNYGIDAKAFEKMIRNDHLIDSIRTLEGKTYFFEMACKKDPHSPYVKQHYARMLLREHRPELALAQIDQAMQMPGTTPRVLNHTKGQTLKAMAVNAEGYEIGRKYVARAEQTYRKSISSSPKDEYAYQGLADLFLAWARKSENEEEAAKYIQKAEEVISEGLRNVRVRDGLWIVSSEISNWLGDQPARLQSLERAVKESPTSTVARYLLAKQYRIAGHPEKAKETLHADVLANPDEYRSVLEYALAILDIGTDMTKNWKEAIAVLSLSTTYGLGDSRFISTYGGLLFLNEQFSEAARVFNESVAREFASIEMQNPFFKPTDRVTMAPLRVVGKITDVHYRQCFVEKEGWPPVICMSSKGGPNLRKNLNVSVGIVFSARGAMAITPHLI